MAILTQNPAIGAFQSGVRFGDEERRAADSELQNRMLFERQLRAESEKRAMDNALRTALGEHYASQGQVQPSVAPAMPAAPGPAPMPTMQPPAATAPMPSMQDPAQTAPMPQQPAIAAVAAPQAQQRSAYAPIMSKLAGTPGSGQAMMQMFSADRQGQAQAAVEARKVKAEGAKEAFAALKEGNIKLARAINDHFGLGIPAQAWGDRNFNTAILKASGIAKAYGLKDDYGAAFLRGYVETYAGAIGQGVPQEQAEQAATQAAVSAMPKGAFEIKHWAPNDKGEIIGFGNRPDQQHNTGVKARPTSTELRISNPGAFPGRGGAAGGGSKQQAYAEWRIETLTASGMPRDQANRIVAGGSSQAFGPKDVARMASSLMRSLDPNTGFPIYKNIREATTAAQEALGVASQQQEARPQPAQGREDPLGLFAPKR